LSFVITGTILTSRGPLGQFLPDMAQILLGWKGIQVYSNEGQQFSQRGDNSKVVKVH
jgi:hypothetical protein